MTQQLDLQVRAAFDEIVRQSPDLGATPTAQVLSLSSPGSAVGDRRVWVAAAAAAVVVVGGAGLVAVTRTPADSALRPAASPTPGMSTAAPITAPVTTVAVGSTPPVVDDRFAALLAPVGAAEVWREVRGLDESWVSEARTFVTPEGRVLSATLKPVQGSFRGEVRQVGASSFTFLNEDGNHVYLTTGECQSVAVLAANEYGAEPWSAEALALLAEVMVDSSDVWAAAPDGWSEIEGGFSELLYETTFTVLDAAGTPSADARLVQTDAPLGHVLALSGMAFATARPATVAGLPSNTDGDRAWVLTDAVGQWYVGWNTAAGSALLSVQTEDGPRSAEPVWVEVTKVLQVGRPEFWAEALQAAGSGAASAGTDPVSTAAATATEQGGVSTSTTVTEQGPATAPACGPQEGG